MGLMKARLLTLLLLFSFFFLPVSAVQADRGDPFGTNVGGNIDAAVNATLPDAVIRAINYTLLFFGLLILATFIYAGVLMVTAQGEEEQVNKSKRIMIYAVIGSLVIMFSYAIVRVITGAHGVIDGGGA
ncbi:hypothetical protein IPN35_06300 [Candidatus Peregrinibacteria bacterium]|nr:MAG: hypothetical protein IPN35_06300 [Candidatus Peregrinibacteria bacterium]